MIDFNTAQLQAEVIKEEIPKYLEKAEALIKEDVPVHRGDLSEIIGYANQFYIGIPFLVQKYFEGKLKTSRKGSPERLKIDLMTDSERERWIQENEFYSRYYGCPYNMNGISKPQHMEIRKSDERKKKIAEDLGLNVDVSHLGTILTKWNKIYKK